MTVLVRYNQKANANVYCCPDCGNIAFILSAENSGWSKKQDRAWHEGEVICPQCGEGFGGDLEVICLGEIDYEDQAD